MLYLKKKNKEKHLEVSLFYTCVPKAYHIILSTVIEIQSVTDWQTGTNYILPVHELSRTQRCLQCMIMHTKIMYSCHHRALEQKYQQKHPFARLYTKYTGFEIIFQSCIMKNTCKMSLVLVLLKCAPWLGLRDRKC